MAASRATPQGWLTDTGSGVSRATPFGWITEQDSEPPAPEEEKPRPETYRYLHMLIR